MPEVNEQQHVQYIHYVQYVHYVPVPPGHPILDCLVTDAGQSPRTLKGRQHKTSATERTVYVKMTDSVSVELLEPK